MPDDPRRKHPSFESSWPAPPAGLRPPRGQVVTRDELPTKPRRNIPAPLPPVPERQPVTISQVEDLLDAAFEEHTGVTAPDPNAPKAAKAAREVINAFPERDRASVAKTALLVFLGVALACAGLLAYSIHLGHVPEFLR